MPAISEPTPIPKRVLWASWSVSAIPVLMLMMSAVMKLTKPAPVVEGLARYGWPEGYLLGLGILELACAILYLIPRTSILGAILVTGFLGGATATHVRVGDLSFVAPVILGVLVWSGLYLRESRLRPLVPLRKRPT